MKETSFSGHMTAKLAMTLKILLALQETLFNIM